MAAHPLPLKGKRFGMLVAVKRVGKRWICRCDCGGEKTVLTHGLIRGETRSCGCAPRKTTLIDLTGKRFGHWHVLSRAESRIRADHTPVIYWRCRCACGAERDVAGLSLRQGTSGSCGCKPKSSHMLLLWCDWALRADVSAAQAEGIMMLFLGNYVAIRVACADDWPRDTTHTAGGTPYLVEAENHAEALAMVDRMGAATYPASDGWTGGAVARPLTADELTSLCRAAPAPKRTKVLA